MAGLIGNHMESHGIRFIKSSVPGSVQKLNNGQLRVSYKNVEFGEEGEEDFDTVMFAVGTNLLYLTYDSVWHFASFGAKYFICVI